MAMSNEEIALELVKLSKELPVGRKDELVDLFVSFLEKIGKGQEKENPF